MGKVLLCVGKRAEKPYFFEKTGQNIYSIEELCYVFGENAYILDEDIEDKELAEWIENECGLSELSGTLHTMINKKVSVSAFVGTIFDYTGYYTKEKSIQIGEILKNGKNLSLYERKKTKADCLVQRGKYAAAIQEYDSLLKEMEGRDPALLAKIHHNKAVAQTSLFAYAYASDEFHKAYEIDGREENYMAYLAAKRLSMKEEDYIRFIAENPEGYAASLLLEKKLNKIRERWQGTKGWEYKEVLLQYKENGGKNLYYREVEKLINELKAEYRECAGK